MPSGDGTKTVYVWYKDGADNPDTSPYSDSIILDMTDPPPPASVTATTVSSSQINLSWSTSYDTGGSGLAGYKIDRVPKFPQLVTTTATNYSDYNLAANTQYCYTVAAYDGAGNTSAAQSTQACAVTQGGLVPGAYLWSEHFGGTTSSDSARATAVAVDGSGNIVIAGLFYGSVDFGGGILSSVAGGNSDIFVAKYTAAGTHLWSRRFGGTSNDVANGVAVDGSGNIVVTGYFSGTVDFGGGPLVSGSNSDVFVAKYSASGSYLWSGHFGGTTMSDSAMATAVAVDGSGNIVVAGYFYGSANFGGGLLSSAGSSDIFVVKYTAAGTHLWSRRFGGTSNDVANGVAVDGSGNIVVTGYFNGMVDFGGGPLVSGGGYDIFLAKYSASGSYLWSDNFGGTSNDVANSVAVDGSGNIVVTGYFNGMVDFGGGPLVSSGGADIFLAKYSAAGAHIWSKQFGSDYTWGELANSVAVDSSGNIALTGSVIGPVDFAGGWLFGKGNYDVFVAKFSAAGGYLWSKRFVGSYNGYGKAVALDTSGNTIVAGTFEEMIDFGGGQLTSPGGTDTFLANLAP